jgi:hypothetical protein
MLARRRALSAYLTREEWQLAFALSFAHEFLGDAGPFASFGESLRYAVSYLAQNGMEFQGVTVTSDGRIIPTQEEPVCPENLASCALIVYGSAPDYETHLPAAIAFAEEVVPHLSHDIEMMNQAFGEVCETVEDMRVLGRREMAERMRFGQEDE